MNTIIQDHNEMLESIEKHPTMVQIHADSFGGVMYNVANRDKYDTADLLAKWDALDASEKESFNGLVKGAINFIKSN